MIPRARLALLVACAGLFAGLAVRWPALWVPVGLLDVAAVGLYIWAASGARGRRAVRVTRSVPPWITVGQPQPLELRVEAAGEGADIVDRLPEGLAPREAHFSATGSTTIPRWVTAVRRGRFQLNPPAVAVEAPLGLGWNRGVSETAPELRVLPDLKALARFDSLVRQRRLREMGIVRSRARGEGMEISGLRHYAWGDPFSRIDWKATARRGKPVVREHEAEKQQPLLVLLDAGRRMARETDGRSRLDEAIEASLLLSHVALRSDDRVGLLAFADVVVRTVGVGRGVAHAKRIARATFDLEPVLREPPYAAIASRVYQANPRRSLVVLFTDVIEPSSLKQLVAPLRFLGRRHLCLCVVFKDLALEAALTQPPTDEAGLYLAGAAASLWRERAAGLTALRRAGALVLEAEPGKLSAAVVNNYLEVKSRRLL